MNIKHFFTSDQRNAIQISIANAEKMTSGEIRVHISKRCKGDVLEEAAKVFRTLKMDQTKLHNGVLIYFAPLDKKIAILGDKGIHEKVPEGFWDKAYAVMKAEFSEARFSEGLCAAIEMAGEQLQLYFPYHGDDSNELDNEISYGE